MKTLRKYKCQLLGKKKSENKKLFSRLSQNLVSFVSSIFEAQIWLLIQLMFIFYLLATAYTAWFLSKLSFNFSTLDTFIAVLLS